MLDYVVTDLLYEEEAFTAAALYDGHRLTDLRLVRKGAVEEVGAVALGHITERKQKKGAAFVRVGKQDLYVDDLPEKVTEPIMLQITKEAQMKKLPTASTRIRLPGEYLILTPDQSGVSFSAKLKKAERAKLKGAVPEWSGSCGLLFRTNAKEATPEAIRDEAERLKARYDKILAEARKGSSGTYLDRPEKFYIEMLRDFYQRPERIFCDTQDKADELLPYTEAKDAASLLYEPKSLSLAELYRLPQELRRLRERKVWLKSGAYLYIDFTEACIVIDVNSGRNQSGRKADPLSINKEAAKECVRQMRLRNLSGMILIDFISMHSKEEENELLQYMRELCHREQNPSDAIDMTGLGLMELTRKRTRPSLVEVLRGN